MITVALLGVDVTRHHTLAALWGSSGARPDEDTVMRNFGKTVVIMLDVSVAGLVVASEGGGRGEPLLGALHRAGCTLPGGTCTGSIVL